MTGFFNFPDRGKKNRINACSICGEDKANIIGRLNYIGIDTYDVVQCPECGLASFDAVPDSKVTAAGCERNYLLQYSGFSRKRLLHGYRRAFRRGGHFARNYLAKLFDKNAQFNILEIGAGSGYFSQGIKRHFPNAKLHYVDIVPELVEHYKNSFDCDAVAGEFSPTLFPDKKFDLVIARDLLEHVHNPLQFCQDVNKVLSEQGYFFFITPNGREDIWECNQRYTVLGEASLVHQNHYHYFLPETLDRLLNLAGFEKTTAFKWGLRRHRKGFGHKMMKSFKPLKIPPAEDFSDKAMLSNTLVHDKREVFNSRQHGRGILSRIYSAFVDRAKSKTDYYDYKGHEFFVIAQKLKLNKSEVTLK